MNWEEDREEYLLSGRFKSPDDIQKKILDKAQTKSTEALLYLCLLLFGVGLLATLVYFLV